MNKYDHLSRYKIDFEESHYNLSLKDYHLFNYIEEKCQEMDFLFKGDDDILLIPENLMYHINFLRERSVSIFYFNRPNGPKSIFNFFSFKKFHFILTIFIKPKYISFVSIMSVTRVRIF